MKNVEVEKMLSGALLLLISLSCALISPLVVIACFAVLVLGIGAILRPRFALLLLFMGAGLPSITLPLPEHNMHLVEPITVLVFLVIIVYRPSVHFSIPHLLGLLFLALAIISFIHVPELVGDSSPYAADKRLVALLITIAAFFAGTWLANTVEDGVAFLIAILLVSMPLYCVGLAQAMGVHLSPLLESPDAYNPQIAQGRLWGPFAWSVNFGMYLVNLIAVAVVCWLQGTCHSHRMIGFVMTIVTALEIVGSGTRSATFAAIVVIIVACLICRRGKILSFSLLLAGIGSISFFNKIALLFSHDVSSTDNRLLLWNEAIRLIIANPWFGIGLQQFHYQSFTVRDHARSKSLRSQSIRVNREEQLLSTSQITSMALITLTQLKDLIHLASNIFLHRREQMGIGIHRHGNGTMSQ